MFCIDWIDARESLHIANFSAFVSVYFAASRIATISHVNTELYVGRIPIFIVSVSEVCSLIVFLVSC